MRRSVWLVILPPGVLLLLMGVWWLWSPAPERTSLTFFQSYGHVVTGERLGVRVGMSLEEASAHLVRQGLVPVPEYDRQVRSCGGRMVASQEEVRSFADNTWRHGGVCLFVTSGRVVAIGWSFNGPLPVF